MNFSKGGLDLTKQFEGCRYKAYRDGGGVWTIGFGHTHGVHEGMSCTQKEAEAWLEQDVQNAVAQVNKCLTIIVTQDEFDALVDFEFNTGALRKSTLLKLLNAGDCEGAAAEFAKWDKDNGKRVAGLARRRKAEHDKFLDWGTECVG